LRFLPVFFTSRAPLWAKEVHPPEVFFSFPLPRDLLLGASVFLRGQTLSGPLPPASFSPFPSNRGEGSLFRFPVLGSYPSPRVFSSPPSCPGLSWSWAVVRDSVEFLAVVGFPLELLIFGMPLHLFFFSKELDFFLDPPPPVPPNQWTMVTPDGSNLLRTLIPFLSQHFFLSFPQYSLERRCPFFTCPGTPPSFFFYVPVSKCLPRRLNFPVGDLFGEALVTDLLSPRADRPNVALPLLENPPPPVPSASGPPRWGPLSTGLRVCIKFFSGLPPGVFFW